MVTRNLDQHNLQNLADDTIAALLRQPGAKTSNGNISCRSPFRDDRKPSFSFSIEKLTGCDFGDNNRGYGLKETAAALGLRVEDYTGGAPISIPTRPVNERRQESAEPPPPAWQKAAAAIVGQGQRALWNNPAMLRYLRDERLLTDETIQARGLGYNPGWRDMATGGKVAPGILIPYDQPGGNLWAVRVRTFDKKLHDEGKKYINITSSKVSGTLYGAQALDQYPAAPVLFVEGEFDAMLAQQHAGEALAVVTLGPAGNKLSPTWAERLQGRRVLLALDNDPAGQAAAAELAAQLPGAVVLGYPDGIKDYTDYRKAGGTLADLLRQGRVWWPDGLPDAVQAALMNRRYFPDSTVNLVEALRRGVSDGTLDPDAITVKAIEAVIEAHGLKLPSGTLYRLVKKHSDLFFLTSEYPINTLLRSENKSVANSRGRPTLTFRLKTQAELIAAMLEYIGVVEDEKEHGNLLHRSTKTEMQAIGGFTGDVLAERAAALDDSMAAELSQQNGAERFARKRAIDTVERLRKALENPHSTPLEGDLTSVKGRRIALCRAVISETDSRRVIRQKIGLGDGSLGPYMKAAGIERRATDRIEKPVNAAADAFTLSKGIGKPLKLVARIAGETVEQAVDPAEKHEMSAFIQRARAQGAAPVVVIQPPYRNVKIDPVEAAPVVEKPNRKPIKRASRRYADPTPKTQVYGPEKWAQRFTWKAETVLKMRGWGRAGDGFIEPDTGEIYEPASLLDLYEMIVRRPVSTGDALLDMARLEFGAVIHWLDDDELEQIA